MRPLIAITLASALSAGPIALALCARAGAPTPAPARPTASAAADSLGAHYAALELIADSVVAAQAADNAAPSELAQEDAGRLAADPATGSADVRDLADRLSGVLELGRVTGRMASRTFSTPAARQQDRPATPSPLPATTARQ